MKALKENFLVVSDYNWLPDNIEESWVHKLTDNYIIYDRADRWPASDKIKKQVNVGQNIYDMFDFIIDNYDNLPKAAIFCRAAVMFPKGRPYPQSNGTCGEETFHRLMNNETFTEMHDFGPEVHNGVSSKLDSDGFGYLEINNSWYFEMHPFKYFYNLNQFLVDVYKNPVITTYIRFAPGATYLIPKENMLKYSRNFYEKMKEIISWGPRIAEAHMMERLLYTIFTCDWEVNDKYK